MFGAVLLLASCAPRMVNLTAAQEFYLRTVRRLPTTFKVANADAEMTWGRAQAFVARAGRLNILVASNYIVQTYNGDGSTASFTVTRMPGRDSTEFSVQTATRSPLSIFEARADDDAHMCVDAMISGEILHPELVW
jgi:hypothetical protein